MLLQLAFDVSQHNTNTSVNVDDALNDVSSNTSVASFLPIQTLSLSTLLLPTTTTTTLFVVSYLFKEQTLFVVVSYLAFEEPTALLRSMLDGSKDEL
jgi:hypothetical protein